MATKPKGSLLPVIVLMALSAISAAYKWAQENMIIIIAVVSAIILFLAIRSHMRKKRFAAWVLHLQEKYKKPEIVEGILKKQYWIGQTQEQLVDSRGCPENIDRKILKTKTKEIWKYNQLRKGQYAIKITLDNGKVAGWEDKVG